MYPQSHGWATLRYSTSRYQAVRAFHQLVISCIDHYNAILKGTPTCVIKPLQMVQNAAAHLAINQPKWAHTIPLLIELHWLPVVSHFKFKSLIETNRVLAASALSYLNNLVWPMLPLILCVLHMTQESSLYGHNPNYFHIVSLNGGTTSQALAEQEKLHLLSKRSWKHSSS